MREEAFIIIFTSRPYEIKESNNKLSFHYLGSDLESPHLGCFLKNYFEQIRNKSPKVEFFFKFSVHDPTKTFSTYLTLLWNFSIPIWLKIVT